ncbi:mammalian cell entry protein [Rhodococcus sp. SGAir0479]|uniref:mammalian cell entry protein n=1 Tax=Rhodococcus sp. SGAir0479 TaxID=2567884 RepID=UPI0020C79B27|nr:mammalian cell entry protein [Rhodococcus sp. SGAir0479]
MPPIRRRTGAGPSPRRPKVAGSSAGAVPPARPAAGTAEPEGVEPAATRVEPAATRVEPAATRVEPAATRAEEPGPAASGTGQQSFGTAVAERAAEERAIAHVDADAPDGEAPDPDYVPPSEQTADGETEDAPTRSRLSWRLVAALGVAAVVLAVFAVVAALRPGAEVNNTAFVDIAGTSEVTEAARSALETLYAYAPDSIDQYPDRAHAVLTDSMRAEFDKTVEPTVSAVKQSGTSTTVQLSDVGVKVLDGDRAELIVNMTVSAEMNGVAQDSASGPLIVQMEKVGGVWLLSDIADQ